MENTVAIGLSRQIVLERALNITANNIANQTTTGYKAERVNFQEYLVEERSAAGNLQEDISFVIDPDSRTDFSQGGLTQTHGTLDFAINGEGFFAVETENGVRYTRDGHFGVSPFGELVTRDGYTVLDDTGSPILFDTVGGDPLLSPEGDLQQGGITLARLGVYTFADTNTLSREGSNLFRANLEGTPLNQPSITQGFVETANINAIEGITQLIDISRAYAQAAELIETSNELSRQAVQTLTETV